MAQRHVLVWNATASQIQNLQVGDTGLLNADLDIVGNLTISGTVDGRDLAADGTKVDLLTVTGAVDLDAFGTRLTAAEAVTGNITVTAATDLDSIRTKAGYITVTSAVDLDALNASVGGLTSPVVLMGSADLSGGFFPASTNAGESWIVSVGGSIGGTDYFAGDRIIALQDSASNVLPSHWYQDRFTDSVTDVNGKVGSVTLVEADISDLQSYLLSTDIDTIGKLSTIVGENLMTVEQVDTLAELNGLFTDGTVLDTSSDPRDPNAHTHSAADLPSFPFSIDMNFTAPDVASGTYYVGGFYDAPATDANLTQAATTQVYGSANSSNAAHAFMVFGAGSTDGSTITITVTGTSIADDGTRTPADSEVLYTGAVAGLTANDYLETTKRWLGQVTYTLTSDGVNFTCDFNYGFAEFKHLHNTSALTLQRFVISGLANATDANADFELLHHSDAGWTYSAAAFEPGSAALAGMQAAYGADAGIVNDEHFSFDRNSLSQAITSDEGFLVRVTTSAAKSIRYADIQVSGTATYV